ncbi:hypothetical protein TSTA_001620 [Talaromyces stipitatus ATCC 10500]|uniref:Bacteriophage T5 Orf172 DNA-binding domain-containing protein n=1 Tax=Talaromyces stipitatus (strain ATCC 10500 / CBS 375.48 / QM 6759 / NRRL 1006) TaxID=441959 RepID=B8MSX6_TALSN|nr:uncharacterized protein TSTA_001620 [Talaromyces stipitatus ATCC 10500]EED12091.1 hypothetical protein TSTA_001620 [Talaromyces stipitatus ATCC 10500]
MTMPPEAVSIEMLEDYVQFNCCRMGNAQHRDRIEDVGYLRPLAQRWQDEIRRYASSQHNHTTTVPAPDEDIYIRHGYTTPAPSTPSYTRTLNTPIGSPSYYQYNTATAIRSNAAPFTSVASSTYYQDGYATPAPSTPSYGTTVYTAASSPSSSQSNVGVVDNSNSSYYQYSFPVSSPAPQPYGYSQRYDLRPREGNLHQSIPQAPPSEFRPHITNPLPSDSISRKIAEPLEDRDFETGSLYIFDRASSPGHVKIGWTASSVQRRLEDWSKCGYIPNLLFSVDCIPHAQRVETLTHYELIKQWRRERRCKADWCQKSHKEWFEIDKEQAKQVLRNWADFMQYAEPYDAAGRLKSQWREIVKMMEGYGEMVTATKLLEHYEASLTKKSTVAETTRPVSIHTPKIVEEVVTGYKPTIRRLEAPKEEVVRVDSLVTEQPTLPKEAPLITGQPVLKTKPDIKSKPQPSRTLFSAGLIKEAPSLKPLPKTEPILKTEPVTKTEPLSKTEPLLKTEQLPRTQSLFSAEYSTPLKDKPLFEWQSLLKTETPTKLEPLPRKQFSFSTEQHTPSKTPLFQWQPLLKSEPLFKTTPLPRTEFEFSADRQTPSKEPPLFKWQSLLKTEPLFKTESVPRTFMFSAKQPVKSEPLFNSSLPVNVETLSKAEIVIKSEPVDDEVVASEVTPVKEGLLPEQIPLPPSPLLQPTVFGEDTTSLKETNRNSDDGNAKEEDSDLNSTVADTLADSKAGSSGPSSARVSRSVTPIESSLEKHAQNSTDTTNTESPPSESDTLVPLVTWTSEALASMRSDSQEAVVKTPTSTAQRPKTPEDAGQVEPDEKLHGCEEQICKEKDEITAAVTEVELGLTGWDEDETIVEEQSPKTLEKVALEIVDGIYNDISTGTVNGALKELDKLKVPDSEMQPAIEMVLQA